MIVAQAPLSVNRRQWRHWEQVCLFMEAQPYRAIRYPYPKDIPVTTRLLKRMSQHRLVRHAEDCSWRVSVRWRTILARLQDNAPPEDPLPVPDGQLDPRIIVAGVDTYTLRLVSPALPDGLVRACDEFKAQAVAADGCIETPWLFMDLPLLMYKTGKGTTGGRGVSYGYILRNQLVELKLRRTALTNTIGMLTLSAPGLWTYTPRGMLDEAIALLQQMWVWQWERVVDEETGEIQQPEYPGLVPSRIDLCVDVAHFQLQPADLDRVLTRSVRQTVFVPQVGEDIGPYAPDDGDLAFVDTWEPEVPTFFDLSDLDETDWDAADEEDDEQDESDDEHQLEEDDAESSAEEEGMQVHLWAKRATGIQFSPGGDLMARFYDKRLHIRQQWGRMQWMKEVHLAHGWHEEEPLMRIEAQFRRGTLVAFKAALGEEQGAWLDDPYGLLDHLPDLFGYFAGLPPEVNVADVTYGGWLRLAVPLADETRSRWPTDPVWQVIQRAPFADRMPVPLERKRVAKASLLQIDAEILGLLRTRSVMRGAVLDEGLNVRREVMAYLADLLNEHEDWIAEYLWQCREKARQRGQAVPVLSASGQRGA